MRLIDADSIELRYKSAIVSDDSLIYIPMRDVKKSIANTQTVDAVEVVRCKDCEYGKISDPDFQNQYLCTYYGDIWNSGNHFCSYGERIEQ